MRKQFCRYIVDHLLQKKDFVFLTGDLGFNAFEEIEEYLGHRFINCGISEANMIGVAAGLSFSKLEVWVYSIAPFVSLRPLEQIRNDICFQNLPVRLVGNGGGYGYGIMGPTHHAIEDYGILLTLPNIKCFIPAINEDIKSIMEIINKEKYPTYLRLGTSISNKIISKFTYSKWRNILKGDKGVLIIAGPLVNEYYEWYRLLKKQNRPNIWILSELPINEMDIPNLIIEQIKESKKLFCVEEHVKQGGIGTQILYILKKMGIDRFSFKHHYAKKHIYDLSGSQSWLQRKSELNVESFDSCFY